MDIILYKPEVPGNIGAIARVMENFGFSRLVLIEPQCDHLSKESLDRAKHAKVLLKKTVVTDAKVLTTYSLLIGTTSRLGTDYNVGRAALLVSEFPAALKMHTARKAALLFGPEGTGLTNEMIDRCDFVITIPTGNTYPALNLSHAVAIVLYEISRERFEPLHNERFPLVKPGAKRVLESTITTLVERAYLHRKNVIPNVQLIWKRVLGKAHLTGREAAALIGFFKFWMKKK